MLTFVIMALPMLVFAWGPQAPRPGSQIDNSSNANAPIDGGLSLLLAAGVGYGIKKVREKRKNNKAAKGVMNYKL